MDAYLGMINAFGFTFAPRDWAMCQGQTMSIAQFQALYSLLGVTYGGNGQTTFMLPDLRGRSAIGMGQGPGLSNWPQGAMMGAESHTLTNSEMPQHDHAAAFQPPTCETHVQVANADGTNDTPASGDLMARVMKDGTALPQFVSRHRGTTVSLGGVNSSVSGGSVSVHPAGGSQPFPVLNPRLALNYCICLMGLYPMRD